MPAGDDIDNTNYLVVKSDDAGMGIAVDHFHDVYVTGTTLSQDFPTTLSTPQPVHVGGYDAFAAKLHLITSPNTNGLVLVYGTYIGGVSINGGDTYGDGI